MPREQSVVKLNIARMQARTAKYPSEQGYRESVRDQFRELQYALESVYQQLEDASPAIMYNALLPTFDKSQMYVPVKTGDLKASGYLEITDTVRGSQRVELGYGRGGQPWYAMYVHENLNSYHKPPTRAKWLQEAVYEDLPELPNRLARMYQMFMF
jgi:hypothetical protein